MEVQLRPSRPRVHPLYRYARRGIGATYNPLDCTAIIMQGGTGTACVDENLRRQEQYFREDFEERRAGFVAACNRDWELNDQQYKALGLPRPVNNCADRTFGLTLPGTSGGHVQAQLPTTYMPVAPPAPPPQQSAPPPVAAPIMAPEPYKLLPAPAPAPSGAQPSAGGGVADQIWGAGQQKVTVGGTDFPIWLIAAAGAAVLYFAAKGK